jgi:hypothetical protein
MAIKSVAKEAQEIGLASDMIELGGALAGFASRNIIEL